MISFRLNEIPEGVSDENLLVGADDLDMDFPGIEQVQLHLRFHKREDNVRIECNISAQARLVCDRSLDTFPMDLKAEYEVVFQTKAEEEREDLAGALKRMDPSQNILDITRELRDSLLLSVPVKKLHPRYYEGGNITEFEASYGDSEKEIDPRWNELKKLKQNIPKN